MSDDGAAKVSDLVIPVESNAALPESAEVSKAATEETGTNGTKAAGETEVVKDDAPLEATPSESVADKQVVSEEATEDKSATVPEDNETKAETTSKDATPSADDATEQLVDTPATGSKSKANARRKSGGIPEHKSRKLTKKQSKAKLTHTDAKPGDYFYIRLKGYPLWPGIVCDEDMLPDTILKSRPLTAARADGTYRDAYADGGPKEKDRTFAVMYLYTNEFSWIPNRDLVDLDFETVDKNLKGRKDLQEAHKLAAQQHDLSYFKEMLNEFVAQQKAEIQARAEAAEAAEQSKEAALAAKASKPKKVKSQKNVVDDDEDAEMLDVDADADTSAINNKRKAVEDGASTEPSKKVKLSLKLNSTPKASNGTATPKSAKETPAAKVTKTKAKKATPKVAATPEAVAPKEPELTAEEKRAKKEKEILFLRHKLQKGLLTRDQPPKEDEMKHMSEFVSKLEGYSELEVSIIRATKINKVLKAILKLASIPKEEEFNFKPRSQTLLDKWNKLLATEQSVPAAATNGASDARGEADEAKPSPVESTNGAKEASAKSEEETAVPLKSPTPEKDEPAAPVESTSDPLPEKPIEAPNAAVDETAA